MEITLLYFLYVCSHLNDISVDWLIVEEFNTFIVDFCLTCRSISRNHAAVSQSIVICCCASAECISEEIFCKINISTVGCNIKG